jgi:cholesterol transport system auxiliary component
MSVDFKQLRVSPQGALSGAPDAPWVRAGVLVGVCLVMAGCSLLDKPVRAAVYDFGPGQSAVMASVNAGGLPVLTLAEVDAASALDSTAVLYRLAYANAQQLLPYAQARWSMTPAQLLRQRLRESLGQRRSVLSPGDGNLAGVQPALLLRIELEEFSQLFTAPAQSVGLVRLRATLVQSSALGEHLLGQRVVVAQRAALTADAPGGVRALSEASDAAVLELEQWLSQAR